jgi:hypothetical protein
MYLYLGYEMFLAVLWYQRLQVRHPNWRVPWTWEALMERTMLLEIKIVR